jgi:hypothetical protein
LRIIEFRTIMVQSDRVCFKTCEALPVSSNDQKGCLPYGRRTDLVHYRIESKKGECKNGSQPRYLPYRIPLDDFMPHASPNKSSHPVEHLRALRLLKLTLGEISDRIGIKDYSEYEHSEHFIWRHWPEQQGSIPVSQPSHSSAIFKRETKHDVILMIQTNHDIGATWTEIPMLPIAILYLGLWEYRLNQKDANRVFNIHDEEARQGSVDRLTCEQLSDFVMLLVVSLHDAVGRAFYDSVHSLIHKMVEPYLRTYWRSKGIPTNFQLFPQLVRESQEFDARADAFRKAWLRRMHGGARNFAGFPARQDVSAIVHFIESVRPLWNYVIEYFSVEDYHADCVQRIKSDIHFRALLGNSNVSDTLMKRVHRRRDSERNGAIPKQLQPLGFAVEHARETFQIDKSHATVLRWYRRLRPSQNPIPSGRSTSKKI